MLRRALYFGVVLPLAVTLAWALSWVFPKLRAGFGQRQGVWKRLQRLAVRRDPKRPLVWFHVASAGEFLQMEPLLRRARESGSQIAVTITSISGLRWLERIAPWPETVWADLLPWEGLRTAARLFDALSPNLVVYAQADLWPGLIWEGSHRKVPQALLVARLDSRGGRARSLLLRWFYRDLYSKMTTILAGSAPDLTALRQLVPQHPALSLGGDPGMETVLQRLDEAALPPYPPGTAHSPVLVAGSTWPPDELLLASAFAKLREAWPTLRLIIAPHEPTEDHLTALEGTFRQPGTRRLSQIYERQQGEPSKDRTNAPVVLVDRVGKLAGLYRLGTLAYVGGAFTTGVHNVAEPAAAGLPVCFGPRYHNSPAARLLLEAELATVVADANTLESTLGALLKSPERCVTVGRQSRSRIESMAAAARVNWDALVACVPELRKSR